MCELESLVLLNCHFLLKLQIQFSPNQNFSKLFFFFVEIDQLKFKESKIAKTTQGKNKVGRPALSAFRANSKAAVLKTVRYGHEGRQIDQQSRIKNPEIDPHVYG